MGVVDDDRTRKLGQPAIDRDLEDRHDNPRNPKVKRAQCAGLGDEAVDDDCCQDCTDGLNGVESHANFFA